MSKQGLPTKHHYIPEFYLRQWISDDGMFERYNQPIPSKIVVRRAYPSEAGWMKDLYTSPGDQSGAQWLENDVFQVIDSRAAPALRKLNAEPQSELGAEERSAWTVFIRSLFHRTPENLRATISTATKIYEETLEETRERYSELRGETDPETFDEYKSSLTPAETRRRVLSSLPSVITNAVIGQFMLDMPTSVFTLPSGTRDFLLSDDPIVRTNGLKKEGGHLAMPISPRKLFVSAWKNETLNEIARMKPDDLVRAMNIQIVEGACYFVVSKDRSQDRFIRNRFGQKPRKPILG